MSDLVGKRVFVAHRDAEAVAERLRSTGALVEVVQRTLDSEIRYESSPLTDSLVAPWILPPRWNEQNTGTEPK